MQESHIGLIDPKSTDNVGAVMRAAARFRTDTQRQAMEIPLLRVNSCLEQAPPNTHLVCVELVEGAQALPEYTHPDNAFYIFGPEDGSIPQQIIDQADAIIYVPTVGCMNLAASVNVVLYDRLAKSRYACGDELIRESRDTNNRLKVPKSQTTL